MRGIIKEFFDEDSKFILIVTIAIMLLAHAFCFMNVMYSHDSLYFCTSVNEEKVIAGRWLYPFVSKIRFFSSPWLMGIISTICVSLSVVIVSKVLRLKRVQGICVAILFASNITLTALFCTYIFDADADCLSLFFACFAVYSFENVPRIFRIVSTCGSLVICLSLYQAYVCVALGLFVLLIISEGINSNSWNDIKKVFLKVGKIVGVLIITLIVYLASIKISSYCYGVELTKNSYNGAGNLRSLSVNSIVGGIPKAYLYFFKCLTDVTGYNMRVIVGINVIMVFLLCISFIIYVCAQECFFQSLIIILPSVILMPLALNFIYLVSMGMMHQLMIFAFCLLYLLPVILLNNQKNIKSILLKKLKEICNYLLIVLIMVLGVNNIIYSNGAYTHKKIVFDNTLLHAQTIWKDVNCIEGYIEGKTEIVFIGDVLSSKIVCNSPTGERYVGVMIGSSSSAITYGSTIEKFYCDFLGRNMNINYNDSLDKNNKDLKEMPKYPTNGYCQMRNGKVYVKLSEIE